MMKVRKPSQEEIARAKNWDIWTKEISEFPWHYDENETCYIIEGESIVTAENGSVISFGPGDWVEFEEGLTCTWKITKPIKKYYKFG